MLGVRSVFAHHNARLGCVAAGVGGGEGGADVSFRGGESAEYREVIYLHCRRARHMGED